MNSIVPLLRKAYALNTWRGKLLLAVTILLAVLVTARIILTPSIILLSTNWLKKQGIDAHIEDIDISFTNGTVSLIDARGEKDGSPLFHIGKVNISWLWTPLSNRTVSITGVELQSLKINIELYRDLIIVGGVNIPLTGDTTDAPPEEPQEKAEPWAAALGTVSFKELDICYLQHQSNFADASKQNRYLDHCLNVGDLTWQGNIGYALDPELVQTDPVPVEITGDFSISDILVTDNRLGKTLLRSKTNQIDGFSVSGLNAIHMQTLVMQELSALQRNDDKHVDSVRYSNLTISDIDFKNLNELTIDDIRLDAPGLYMVKTGDNDWEYQQWIPKPAGQEETHAPGNDADQNASKFVFSLNTLSVTQPDMCYLDQPQQVYYCFTQQSLNWQGTIKHATGTGKTDGLVIKGSLSMKDTRVRNHTISRDLVDIDSVQLSKLAIDPAMHVTLAKLDIAELRALQRTDAVNDFTTMFSSLDISDISYQENNLAIDTVTLNGLKTMLSKNKDGGFEHDKWIPEPASKKSTAAEAKPGKQEPFRFSLNRFLLDTKEHTVFVDNSTTPPMEVGLSTLVVELAKLDPSKPSEDSPVELHAKTLKHSTIDLKGTARPFEEKISFDIDGELKGFDLKVATPATKKAIGHIIKSGQLDAKLDLKATQGQLDSNIALSLYQFNIESMSNKDAAELDKKLGIPLNKTLVLLRDKDGSIHLDIPVTGDVNNPDFDPMDAIIKATTKAATVTVITFYTPYGLIYAGGNVLFDLATALNFDPVMFEPGSSELNEAAKSQLDDLARLLTEKPQLRLTLCGQTNRDDLYALYPSLKPESRDAASSKDEDIQKEPGTDNSTSNTQPDIQLDEQQRAALSLLANSRQDNLKNHLIKEKGVAHERLILCEPAYNDDEEAISGVDINI